MNARIRILILLMFIALAWLLAPRLQAQQVLWGSPVGEASETSAGVPLNTSFTFQVGAFFENGVAGWEPTAANTAEWADHWLSGDSAVYNAGFKTFTGSCFGDAALAGAQGYIWGFDSKSSNGEWILITDPAWVFPAGGSALSFPPSWQTSGASVVIVGSVNEGGVHLRTAAVSESPPPYVPGEQWLGMHFTEAQLAQPLISDWGADPDGDGLSNLLEMAIGAPPQSAGGPERLPEHGLVEAGGNFFLSLAIRRAPNVGAVLGAEVSGDLVHWESGAGKVVVVSEEPDELVVRDSVALEAGGKRYIRLVVSLEE